MCSTLTRSHVESDSFGVYKRQPLDAAKHKSPKGYHLTRNIDDDNCVACGLCRRGHRQRMPLYCRISHHTCHRNSRGYICQDARKEGLKAGLLRMKEITDGVSEKEIRKSMEVLV